MAFADVLFPMNIAYGSQGGPQFSTTIVTSGGGSEQRNRNRYQPLWKWNVLYGIKTAADYFTLYTFFLCRGGKWQSFRYQDRYDYLLVNEPIAVADGAQTVFQTTKTYRSGDDVLVRNITKLSGETHIYGDNVELLGGVTGDVLTGKWTFDAPPTGGTVISVSTTFQTAARFDTDYLPAISEAVGELGTLLLRIENIPVVEAPNE